MFSTERRHLLYSEFHQRYPTTISPGSCVSHIVLHNPDSNLGESLDDLKRLCVEIGVVEPKSGIRHYFQSTKSMAIKWEHHTEFVSYTFYDRSSHREPFTQFNPIAHFKAWGSALKGELLTAVHIEIILPPKNALKQPPPGEFFSYTPIAGGAVCDNHATLWSDFHIYEDGFSKIAVIDHGLGPHRAGRLVQRLIDVETYRILAMLGYEYFKEIKHEVSKLEVTLSSLKNSHSESPSSKTDKKRLHSLLDLSAQTDDLQTKSTPRREATRIYTQLVQQRLEELNEERIQGAQRLSNFLRRRFVPAMNSSETTYGRLTVLTQNIQRDAALLRTRLDVSRQELNTKILLAMHQRLQLQLKLQQTVEALSTVAISYYAINIFSVFTKAFIPKNFTLPAMTLTALAAPLIIFIVYFYTRCARKRFTQHSLKPDVKSEVMVNI